MATTPNAQSLFTFDSSDVRLKVTYKGEAVMAHVSSAAMSLASPVWKKFIFPPWKTKKQSLKPRSKPPMKKRKTVETNHNDQDTSSCPVEELDFTDDNGEALLILLRIAHLQFHDNPTSLSYETLLNLAILCNQYLCINLVRPWLPQWLEDEEESSKEPKRENWLFIAWVFGRKEIFKDLAIRMVREVKPLEQDVNVMKGDGSEHRISEPMPPGIIERILEVRSEVIDRMLEITYAMVDSYLERKVTLCSSKIPFARFDDCDTMIRGSLHRGLQQLHIWPKVNHQNIEVSINEFASQLKGMRTRYVHTHCEMTPFSHLFAVELSSIPDPTLDSHRRHMNAQAGGGP